MQHCLCPTCRLNGYQGRSFIEYCMNRYCTAHPQYLSIKRYKQALAGLGSPAQDTMPKPFKVPIPVKPTVYTPPTRRKPELDTYVLSFRDGRDVEQDWFIKSDDDEDASNQAMNLMKALPFHVSEFTLIREVHVNFVRLLNR